MLKSLIQTLLLLLLVPLPASAQELTIDCAHPLGSLKPLHGVNNGPICEGGLVDLTAYYREIAVPYIRLHDTQWPNPDVVDIHTLFPDAAADPAKPENYRFERTDAFLKSAAATNARIVFRLGESIEHSTVKSWVHPPKDPQRFAEVCAAIVRHYNRGWANGLKLGIQHWEIWNEPENRPNCWTGTDAQYYELYELTSKRLRQEFPDLQIGGPAVGSLGKLDNGKLIPTDFVRGFLDRCKAQNLPLDFFSWHRYGNDPDSFAERARAVRRLLDDYGFSKTKSHLTEWNYLPDNDWGPVLLAGQGLPRQRHYQRMGSNEGAAFIAATLIALQDTPLDVAAFFTGDNSTFGLFTRDGVPRQTYHAFQFFSQLLPDQTRVECTPPDDIRALATLNNKTHALHLLLSNLTSTEKTLTLTINNPPWDLSTTTASTSLLDTHPALAHSESHPPPKQLHLPPHSVLLLKITH